MVRVTHYLVGVAQVHCVGMERLVAEDRQPRKENDIEDDKKGKLENTQVKGNAKIGKGTVITNSTVNGPVVIGEDCKITDSRIEPYSSIGSGCVIKGSGVENSIVMDKTKLENVDRVSDSLIGKNVQIKEEGQKEKKFILGDGSQMTI